MCAHRPVLLICFLLPILAGCDDDEPKATLALESAFVGNTAIDLAGGTSKDLPVDASITLNFSAPVDESTATSGIQLAAGSEVVPAQVNVSGGSSLVVHPTGTLEYNTVYTVSITESLKGAQGQSVTPGTFSFRTTMVDLEVTSVAVNGELITSFARVSNVPLNMNIVLTFSGAVDESLFQSAIELQGPGVPTVSFAFSDDGKSVTLNSASPLVYLAKYVFTISDALKGKGGEKVKPFTLTFYTEADESPKFPVIPDEDLLTLVQQQTFKYFYDFAHPTSGMARERNTSGDLVTSGGSGFGIMALIVGIERNFITRQQGLERFDRILDFLETADRFHGAWSHWINGNTGNVIPFSANDNGGDLVETSFLVQGLITLRQYLDPGVPEEQDLIDRINALWHGVEWDWYTRDGQDVLYWHWSPDKDWVMNHQIRGYNECLIAYVLAASSPTHAIDADVYHKGWVNNGAIQNGKTFYGITLPLGFDYGGPLFFAHYSFLGLDPRNLQDTYADYWTQNVNHTLINQAHAINNPRNFVGYSEENWGFTASDNHEGYSAHSPTNDKGVITPTAALSSFPYTPEESMKALKFFYYTMGDRLWGDYGFYDAFNITHGWVANSFLAIDQGPIVVMIENYRTGLLWDLFMSAPEVQAGLTKLGFTY